MLLKSQIKKIKKKKNIIKINYIKKKKIIQKIFKKKNNTFTTKQYIFIIN